MASKRSLCLGGIKKVTLLHEEALARFQPFLKKAGFPVIYVMNSMGWPRSGHVSLFIDNEVMPVERKIRIIDLSSGKEVPAQITGKRNEGTYWVLEVSDVPALGYKAFKIEVTEDAASKRIDADSDAEVIENEYYRLVIDKPTGSIRSLFDKEMNQELADRENPYHIGQPVRETSAKRDVPPFIRTSVSNVRVEKGEMGRCGKALRYPPIWMVLKKVQGDPKGIDLEIRLYKNVKKVEFRYMAHKLIRTDPEALYVAFPFSLAGSRIVFETIGGKLETGTTIARILFGLECSTKFRCSSRKSGPDNRGQQ